MSTNTTHEKSDFGLNKEEKLSYLSENESLIDKSKCEFTDSIPPVLEIFNIEKKLGSGSFSTVYLGSLKKDPSQRYALKHIVATNHPSRTINELRFLKQFGGRSSIIAMTTCIRHLDVVVLVMPLFEHDKFQTYVDNMSEEEVKNYMWHLLHSLSTLHADAIIHRDVKPTNFLYNRKLNRFALIDFGLSQQLPSSSKDGAMRRKTLSGSSHKPLSTNHNTNLLPPSHPPDVTCQCVCRPKVCKVCLSKPSQTAARAGTPGFRAPEVLMKCPNQTTAIDLWSAGIIMLSLISGVYPIIKPTDDLTSLCHMSQLFGSREMTSAAHVVGKKMLCSPTSSPQDLRKFCLEAHLAEKRRRTKKRCGVDDDSGKADEGADDKGNVLKADLMNKTSSVSSSVQTANKRVFLETKPKTTTHTIATTASIATSSSCCLATTLPDSAFYLLRGLLETNSLSRLTALQALKSPFISPPP